MTPTSPKPRTGPATIFEPCANPSTGLLITGPVLRALGSTTAALAGCPVPLEACPSPLELFHAAAQARFRVVKDLMHPGRVRRLPLHELPRQPPGIPERLLKRFE